MHEMTLAMTLGEVFIIESNSAGNGVSAIQYLKELGYKTHFLTGTPEKYSAMNVNPMFIADEWTEIDTIDIVRMLRFLENKHVLAIMTFDDFHIVQASILAQFHGVVHPDIHGLLNVRFKDRTRRKTYGIGKSVEFKVFPVDSAGEKSPIDVPCVVKPVDESGSVGVRVCFTNEDYREALKPLRGLKTNVTGYKHTGDILVEQFIEGDEYSAELIWDQYEEAWRLLGFTKKLLSDLPYCIEVGHVFPYSFGFDQDRTILNTIKEWMKAVNLTRCSAHVEFKFCKGEPVLMEINPRPAGGYINELVRIVRGRDLVSAYVNMSLDRPIDDIIDIPNEKFAAIRFVLPPKSGMIRKVNPPIQEINGIIRYTVNNVERIVSSATSGDDRLGHVIAVGSTEDEALDRAGAFVDNVLFEYDETGRS